MNLEIYNDELIVNKKNINNELVGIYFLFKNEKIVYIGQSKKIFNRIISHCYSKDFDSFTYIECKENELNELEFEFIAKHKPELNSFDGLKSSKYKTFNFLKMNMDKEEFFLLKKFIKKNKIYPQIFNYYDITIFQKAGFGI